MTYRPVTVSAREVRQVARARAAFRELRGPGEEAARAQAIASLPTVAWKGRTLYTIQCSGETGRGPHLRHVPESLLWALVDLQAHRCPFHA